MARSFLGSLARGFVRSAVNQVGRDSGRVISNSLYGDKHAVPVRHVNGANGANAVPYDLTPDADGVVAVARPDLNVRTLALIFYIVVAGCFPVAGPLVMIANGVKRLRRKTIKVKRFIVKDVYTDEATAAESKPGGGREQYAGSIATPEEDGGSKRYDGRQQYIEKTRAPKTDYDQRVDRRVGITYIAAGIILFLLHIYTFAVSNITIERNVTTVGN